MDRTDEAEPHRGCVLVLGAGGFIGGFVVAALRGAGWYVLRGVRPRAQPAADERGCDLAGWTRSEDWLPVLNGVDAVVNAAGLLRDRRGQSLAAVHETAPLALAQACVVRGVTRFVQISALGDPADGEFIASKHRFDAALLALPLQAVVLRPSVIYSTAGSYGGTSLLRALAAFPGWLPLPGDGRWQIQPAAAEDLAELVVRALAGDARGLFEVGAPAPQTLRDYQLQWRRWLGLRGDRVMSVPLVVVEFAVALGEKLRRGPLGAATWRLLQRGVAIAPEQRARVVDAFGTAPRALAEVLAQRASQVQDRWHARLYLLEPVLRLSVVALWGISALAGFLTPAAQIENLAAGSILAGHSPVPLARFAAVVDLALGFWLLTGCRPRQAIAAMLMLLVTYTVVFGAGVPVLWLDPLGGLAKNLVLLPALAVLWVLTDRR
ncbi:DoxX-like family protein [Tahibacter sp. UC22_41]|uniref:DoxX-like family protein n=1 Tax=Tahibacter sp. UC22_41 TaxID=3350178 RepID=UPI0036DC5E41